MIDIVFCGNSHVFDGVLTCLLSILKRSRPDTYRVHILTMDISRLDRRYTPIEARMSSYLDSVLKNYNPENSVVLHDVTELYEKEMAYSPNENCYCSPYTLLRLLSDFVIDTSIERLLYLDCDIMFNRDIHLLTDIDISEVEYAAASDHYGKYLIHPGYINAGVLYFNMVMARKNSLFEKSRIWIRKKKLVFADQSALIRSTTKRLHLRQRYNDQKFLHKHTIIRHFSKRLFYLPYPHTDNIKQWNIEKVQKVFKYHQFDDIYDEYLRLKKEYESEDRT